MRKCLDRVKGESGMLSTERGYSVIERIKAEGRDEGILIGERKGLEKGIEKGRMEDAAKMLAAGFPLSTIADITELSIGEIEKLRKDI